MMNNWSRVCVCEQNEKEIVAAAAAAAAAVNAIAENVGIEVRKIKEW